MLREFCFVHAGACVFETSQVFHGGALFWNESNATVVTHQSPFWFFLLNRRLVLLACVLCHVAVSSWCVWIKLSITSNAFSGLWYLKINQRTPQFYWLIKLYSRAEVCYSLLRHQWFRIWNVYCSVPSFLGTLFKVVSQFWVWILWSAHSKDSYIITLHKRLYFIERTPASTCNTTVKYNYSKFM